VPTALEREAGRDNRDTKGRVETNDVKSRKKLALGPVDALA
jgi:hypothetical protein